MLYKTLDEIMDSQFKIVIICHFSEITYSIRKGESKKADNHSAKLPPTDGT